MKYWETRSTYEYFLSLVMIDYHGNSILLKSSLHNVYIEPSFKAGNNVDCFFKKNLSFTAHIAAYLESLDQTTLSNTFVYHKKVLPSLIPYSFTL